MYKYVFVAMVAAIIVYVGSVFEKRSTAIVRFDNVAARRIITIATYVLASLAFCVVAGLRNNAVGTDVEMYVLPSFESAQSLDIGAFFTAYFHAKWMPLSSLVFWCVPNLTHSVFWLLFAIHAVIVVPVLVAFRLLLKDEAWLAVLIFGIAFFPLSLNIMRQFMGMGFILLSYVFVRKRKFLLFLLFIMVAFLFHETCLLGLLVYPIWLLSSCGIKKYVVSPVVLAVVTITAIQLFFPALNLIAPYIGKFGSYINGRIATSQGAGGLSELEHIIFICMVLGVLYCWFTREERLDDQVKGEVSGLAAIVFFGAAAFSACLYSFQLFRLGFFFLYFATILIPLAAERIIRRQHRIEYVIVAICLLALFGQSYFGSGAHEVVPYSIDLARIF